MVKDIPEDNVEFDVAFWSLYVLMIVVGLVSKSPWAVKFRQVLKILCSVYVTVWLFGHAVKTLLKV
jgi:hypothetical protein